MFDKTVKKPDTEKSDKRDPIKNNVIKEMIETEGSYNKALGLLELALTMDVLVEENPILLTLKTHVTILKAISDELLDNVNKAVNPSIDESERNLLRLHRTQLLKAFFTTYLEFSKTHKIYVEVVQSDAKPFEKINTYLRLHNNKLGLDAHLIMPVQRGPRYEILVASTQKIDAHLDTKNREELTELKQLIAQSLAGINENLSPKKPVVRERYWPGKYTYNYFWGTPSQSVATPSAIPSSSPVPVLEGASSIVTTQEKSSISSSSIPALKPGEASTSQNTISSQADTLDLDDFEEILPSGPN